jgi:hypothetical protein
MSISTSKRAPPLRKSIFDGQHDGRHGREFGLDLILDGLDKLRRKA